VESAGCGGALLAVAGGSGLIPASPGAGAAGLLPVRRNSRQLAVHRHHNRRANPQAPPAETGAGGSFLFDPPALTQAKGATFTVNVMLSGGQNVYSVPLQLNYDPNQLQVVNVSNGGFLSQDGQAVALVHRDDPSPEHCKSRRRVLPERVRLRPGSSGHAHLHSQVAGTIRVEPSRGVAPVIRHASHHHERSAGGRYSAVRNWWRRGTPRLSMSANNDGKL